MAYGDNIGDELAKIKTIFITHFHGDHHLGLINLLAERFNFIANPPKLTIFLPKNLIYWYVPLIRNLFKEMRPNLNFDDYYRIFQSYDYDNNDENA